MAAIALSTAVAGGAFLPPAAAAGGPPNPETVALPAGVFVAGSDRAEREAARELDEAGQVFERTATPAGAGRYIINDGSWDDRGCGVCRPAARHGRPAGLRLS